MAFTVEDGSGVEDANAYIEIAFADEYFTDRAITTWTGTDAAKQAAIIKATDYIDKVYGNRFLGYKNDEDQSLSFPRNDEDEEDGLPKALMQATAEYALRALSAPLAPDPTTSATGKLITAERKKVGPIEKEFQYSEATGVETLKPYPAADMLLSSLITSGSRAIR